MIIVKITMLLLVVTAVYIWSVKLYLKSNIEEAIRYEFKGYRPLYKILVAVLRILCVIGIIASAIWFLFFS